MRNRHELRTTTGQTPTEATQSKSTRRQQILGKVQILFINHTVINKIRGCLIGGAQFVQRHSTNFWPSWPFVTAVLIGRSSMQSSAMLTTPHHVTCMQAHHNIPETISREWKEAKARCYCICSVPSVAMGSIFGASIWCDLRDIHGKQCKRDQSTPKN